jgi:hypothetical protein
MATKKKLHSAKALKPIKPLRGRLAANHNEIVLRG